LCFSASDVLALLLAAADRRDFSLIRFSGFGALVHIVAGVFLDSGCCWY